MRLSARLFHSYCLIPCCLSNVYGTHVMGFHVCYASRFFSLNSQYLFTLRFGLQFSLICLSLFSFIFYFLWWKSSKYVDSAALSIFFPFLWCLLLYRLFDRLTGISLWTWQLIPFSFKASLKSNILTGPSLFFVLTGYIIRSTHILVLAEAFNSSFCQLFPKILSISFK